MPVFICGFAYIFLLYRTASRLVLHRSARWRGGATYPIVKHSSSIVVIVVDPQERAPPPLACGVVAGHAGG